MSILTIVNCLDPVLRKKCKPIQNIHGDLVALSQDMIETMFNAPGSGLAANQIGVPDQIIVVDLGIGTDEKKPATIINPHITASEDEIIGEEGCLSIPEVSGTSPHVLPPGFRIIIHCLKKALPPNTMYRTTVRLKSI